MLCDAMPSVLQVLPAGQAPPPAAPLVPSAALNNVKLQSYWRRHELEPPPKL
jgi:hypothetical protein